MTFDACKRDSVQVDDGSKQHAMFEKVKVLVGFGLEMVIGRRWLSFDFSSYHGLNTTPTHLCAYAGARNAILREILYGSIY